MRRPHLALLAAIALAACKGGGGDAPPPPPDTAAAPIQPPVERPADATPWQVPVHPNSTLIPLDVAPIDPGRGG